ncbi:SDR family NAD(P)-dependent oxidoreductase [Streptomyces sp. NPDC050509]|uniref:SDR family NAD(P)-dependent oxidoreductase n=1 Tax=Streptomyces sp. NPDC050509 TaxID=3365620 RepID=UPI00379B5D0A
MDEFAQRYGPVAVVTGASSGIGRSFATQLADRGLDVVLVARRRDRLHALAEELRDTHGVHASALPVDLADPAAAGEILDAVKSLDVGLLVSNAGFGVKGAFDEGDAGSLSAMLMVIFRTSRLDHLEKDLINRRTRAETAGWRGETEGIDLTLSLLRAKRNETARRLRRPVVNLGIPLPRSTTTSQQITP